MTVTKFYRLSQRAQASRWEYRKTGVGGVVYFENGEGEWIGVPADTVGRLFDEVEMVTQFTPEELEQERLGMAFRRMGEDEAALENGTYL